jgi:hypothetical protein
MTINVVKIGGIYRTRSSAFTMRPKIKVLAIEQLTAFIKIIYPESWGLTNKCTTMMVSTIDKEYKLC